MTKRKKSGETHAQIQGGWTRCDQVSGLTLAIVLGERQNWLHIEHTGTPISDNRDFFFNKDGSFDGTGSCVGERPYAPTTPKPLTECEPPLIPDWCIDPGDVEPPHPRRLHVMRADDPRLRLVQCGECGHWEPGDGPCRVCMVVDEATRDHEENQRLRRALPPPERLRLVADWFDVYDSKTPAPCASGDEVQRDLRAHADAIEAALAEKGTT